MNSSFKRLAWNRRRMKRSRACGPKRPLPGRHGYRSHRRHAARGFMLALNGFGHAKRRAYANGSTRFTSGGCDMTSGISLHIGLNAVDPDQYEGWDGKLTACEADAKDMAALAKQRKFKS